MRVGAVAPPIEVEIEGARVRVAGVAYEAVLAGVPGTPLYHLLLAGESWTVAAQPQGPGRWTLGVGGERTTVEVIDERAQRIAELTAERPLSPPVGTILAPMHGLVVRVTVVVGQQVAAGAELVVVEAMKMENQVRAPRAGLVSAIHVAVGEPVAKGAALVTLGSAGPPDSGADPAPLDAAAPP